MKQNRFKSRVLWVAIVSQVLSILLLTGVISISDSEIINSVTASVLEILTLLGILNSPTSKDTF